MKYGSLLPLLVGTRWDSLWTCSFFIFHIWKTRFYAIRLLRCWNHLNGKGVCALGIWNGSNKSFRFYFLWKIGLILSFLDPIFFTFIFMFFWPFCHFDINWQWFFLCVVYPNK
jgi:hypothetical protein